MLAGQPLNPDNELMLFMHDVLRFISAFMVPISQSVPHIYLSVLPFAPEQSLVARKFRSRFPNIFAVTGGKPGQWPMTVFSAEYHKNEVDQVIFSLDESIFASISRKDGTICICDSETGHCISGPFDYRVYDACFSPDGKCILLKFRSDAVVLDIETGEEQFRIQGSDFAFIDHGRRIVCRHWVDNSEDEGLTRLLVKFWDASNGAPISNRLLFEVNNVAVTRFSPNGHFLAIGRKSEDVIELWSLEDGKDPQRFPYPPGNLLSLHFSPTSDTLMAVESHHIYLWRLDTQEMAKEMASLSFSHAFHYNHQIHVIQSPLTNYLFINRDGAAEIWDISVTSSTMIWETEPLLFIWSICPSHDGHRSLVGYRDGSVSMWDLDSAINQAETADTQDYTDVLTVNAISPSGKMASTCQSSDIKFLDTISGEVVAHTDLEYGHYLNVAFSPDEDRFAFHSDSLVTIYDMMHPENRVSIDFRLRKDARITKVAFQTCNDVVIGTLSRDNSTLTIQVWHWQDPIGFECTYSLDFEGLPLLVAPNGLSIIHLASGTTCYSWNCDTAQFNPIHFDDQVHMYFRGSPAYSSDGKLLTCWSPNDSHVRVWDTQTGHLTSKFPTSEVDEIALSPALIDHPLGNRLIALRLRHENAVCLFDAYTGHLHAQILGSADAYMKFCRDGTALAFYQPNIGLRIWDIADLTDEHRYPTHGYELMLQGMTDGWVMDQDNEPLFWVPVEYRGRLHAPQLKVVIEGPQTSTILDFSNSRFGRNWIECIDKEWLRELEEKEKEVGNLLE